MLCDDDGRTESHFLDIAKGPFHQNYSYEGAGMSFCGVLSTPEKVTVQANTRKVMMTDAVTGNIKLR